MTKDLENRIIAVTGAASGIGLASAQRFLAGGAKVVLIDRDAAALAKICDDAGPMAVSQVTNLLDPASIDAMVPEIIAKVGQIDVFHANAGAYVAGDAWTGDADAWDRMLYLNINSTFRCIHRLPPHMIERKTGDIIATASIAGHTSVVWEPIYTASKHAVTAFISAVRRQVLPYGDRTGRHRAFEGLAARTSCQSQSRCLLNDSDWTARRLSSSAMAGASAFPAPKRWTSPVPGWS